MTSKINTTDSGVPSVTINYGKESLTLPVTELTELITEALAARKAAYEVVRQGKTAAKAALAEKRDAKKAERETAKAARKAEQIAKAEKRLAALRGEINA